MTQNAVEFLTTGHESVFPAEYDRIDALGVGSTGCDVLPCSRHMTSRVTFSTVPYDRNGCMLCTHCS